jgi:hypothetical protein
LVIPPLVVIDTFSSLLIVLNMSYVLNRIVGGLNKGLKGRWGILGGLRSGLEGLMYIYRFLIKRGGVFGFIIDVIDSIAIELLNALICELFSVG